ncbi:hypothetical protein AURDEDRAFT_168518, partial [Auricularia subglabra TFB-10046 SS5]
NYYGYDYTVSTTDNYAADQTADDADAGNNHSASEHDAEALAYYGYDPVEFYGTSALNAEDHDEGAHAVANSLSAGEGGDSEGSSGFASEDEDSQAEDGA